MKYTIERVDRDEAGNYIINKNLTADDATEHVIPNNTKNRHCREVKEWLVNGGVETPYVGPPAIDEWKNKMEHSDIPLPRWAEDLIEGNLPHQSTLDLIADKKDLRATKP